MMQNRSAGVVEEREHHAAQPVAIWDSIHDMQQITSTHRSSLAPPKGHQPLDHENWQQPQTLDITTTTNSRVGVQPSL